MSQADSYALNGTAAYTGWDPTAAVADLKAKGGTPGANGSSGSTASGYQTVTAPNLEDLEEKVYQQNKGYYMQLLAEANGNMQIATDRLHQDYAKGVRTATEDYNRNLGGDLGDLKNQLDSLGITFDTEQKSKVDDLNKRGMAVYQQGPNGETNAIGVQLPNGGSYNPASANLANYDPNNPDNSGMGAYNPMSNLGNLGAGGSQLDQLARDQALRQEAVQRTSNSKIQGLGIDLKRYTNPTATDPSQMGTAENSLNRGIQDATVKNTQDREALAQKVQNDVFTTATGFANSGIDASKANVDNTFNKDLQSTFINNGV